MQLCEISPVVSATEALFQEYEYRLICLDFMTGIYHASGDR